MENVRRSEPTLFGIDAAALHEPEAQRGASAQRAPDGALVDDGKTLLGVSFDERTQAQSSPSDAPQPHQNGPGEERADAGRTLFGSDLLSASDRPKAPAGAGSTITQGGRGEPEQNNEIKQAAIAGTPQGTESARSPRPIASLDAPLRPDRQIAPEQRSSLKKRKKAEPGQRAGVNPDYLPPQGFAPKTGQVFVASGAENEGADTARGRSAKGLIGAAEEKRRQERINERVSELELFIGGERRGSAIQKKSLIRYGGAAAAGVLALSLLIFAFRSGGYEGRLHLDAAGPMIAMSDPGEGEYRLLFGDNANRRASEGERRGEAIVFPISMKQLVLGENKLLVERTLPSGERSEHRLKVHLPYHLDVESEGEALTLNVQVPPRSLLSIDGELIPLDGSGRGKMRLSAGDLSGRGLSRDLAIKLRSQGGETLEERFPLRLPRVRLRVGPPGEEFITERDTIVIEGVTEEGAELRLDGELIPLSEGGRFRAERPLPRYESYRFELEARAYDRLPARAEISGARVRDRAKALDAYPAETPIAYSDLQTDISRFEGRRQRVEGLVYQIERRRGVTELQILSRSCPAGERCPLAISYGGELEIEPYRWVTVAGRIAGTRRIRSADDGEIVHLPRLSAAIVRESAKDTP